MNAPSWRLGFEDADDDLRLRDRLAEVGFTPEAFRELLGGGGYQVPRPNDYPRLLHRLGDEPRDVLLKLLLVGVPQPRPEVEHALAPLPLERCQAAGLVDLAGDRVVPRVRIRAAWDLLFATDAYVLADSEVPADFVMAIGTSTLSLANFSIRTPTRRVLDWGTGCGPLALLAARHADQVVGLDLNARALAYARFNARLNGVDGVEFLQGDRFEPVKDQRFPRILANPPFVISPRARFVYRDSGVRGDVFCRALAREMAAHLEDGGHAQMTFNWVADTPGGLESWFEGLGCDAWVLRTHTWSPDEYAAIWVDADTPDVNAFSKEYGEWMAFLEAEGIEAICGGILTLHRSGSERFDLSQAPDRMLGPCGDAVLRGLAARTYLADRGGDRRLLDDRIQVAPEVRIAQETAFDAGQWRMTGTRARLSAGLAYEAELDPYVAGLLSRLDGSRPLGAVLAEMAERLGLDRAALEAECEPLVRGLVAQGFLLPPE